MSSVTSRGLVGLGIALLGAAGATAAEPNIQFARDIQPLFAKHCLLCHGPDEAEGGLAPDRRELALAELDSGEHAIVPGQPAASALLERVASDDPDLRMPPEGEPLSKAEIAALRSWIEQGANWELHWAYRPLNPAAAPPVKQTQAIRNAIDQFVVAKLEQAKIAPSPEADPATLIKRLHYDLVGLPPEPAEVDAFISDPTEEAYEQLVDRLLASPLGEYPGVLLA